MSISIQSNRSKASQRPRKLSGKGLANALSRRKRSNADGNSSILLRWHLRNDVIGNDGQPKIMSRLLGSWSDRVRKTDVPVGLHMPAMFLFSQLCRPAPIIKHVGPTKTFKALLWRDDKPALFDDCLMVDPKNSDGASRSVIKPGAITMRRTGVINRYHQPIGTLPEFKPLVRQPNALKREADDAVAVWRAARQLEHLEALTQWRR